MPESGITLCQFPQNIIKQLLTFPRLLVELQTPNKTDALNYFDGSASAPARYAHVVLDHRATIDPYYADILVGPLPVVNGTTTWEPLEYPYTRKTGGHVRNLDADDESLYSEWIYPISASIADITLDLWNGTALGKHLRRASHRTLMMVLLLLESNLDNLEYY